jgi:hypothetical protein
MAASAAQLQAHTTSMKLEDQAVTAALYATNQTRDKNSDGQRFSDGSNKLPLTGASVLYNSLLEEYYTTNSGRKVRILPRATEI